MRVALIIIGLWCSGWSQAAIVKNLYQASVDVVDQTPDARSQSILQALHLVLLKVSGQRQLSQEILSLEPERATSYVKSFRYQRDKHSGRLALKVMFAQDQIDRLLRRYQQPIWGTSRPGLLVWQLVDNGRQRMQLNAVKSEWQHVLQEALQNRGLPSVWPKMDNQDQRAFTIDQHQKLAIEPALLASERYNADAVLIGRLVKQEQWLYQGILLQGDQRLALYERSSDKEQLLDNIMARIAEYFASHYAIKTGTEQQRHLVQLTIQNIDSFQSYSAVQQYLKSKVAISKVELLSSRQSQITLLLELSASWQQVWEVIALDRRLRQTEQSNTLVWQPSS